MTEPTFAATVRLEKRNIPISGSDAIPVWTFAPPDRDAADLPLVFLVHGMNGRKESQFEMGLRLANAGFLACALDARHHGERVNEAIRAALASGLGPDFARAFGEVVIGTALEMGAIAESLGRERYGVIGHSMGGYIALQAGASDPNAAVIVSIAGSPDWSLAPDGSPVPPHLLPERARTGSPLAHADAFYPRPLLLLHGDSDPAVSILGPRALHARLASGPYQDAPDRLALVEYPGVGHEWLPDMGARAIEWMTRFLYV